MTILKAVKEIFIPKKDYAGRSIDLVISRLALRTGTCATYWSYLQDEKIYENTVSGMKIYPHEIERKVA